MDIKKDSQMILKWNRYYIFTIIYRLKKIKVNLVVSEALITHVTNRGKVRRMLAIDPFRETSQTGP